jgi:hypothetical protein
VYLSWVSLSSVMMNDDHHMVDFATFSLGGGGSLYISLPFFEELF